MARICLSAQALGRPSNAISEMKGKKANHIFNYGVDGFRRRVARVGLAAGTAVLWLYLSLSLLVHQRLSRDARVLWDRFSFLS